MEPDFRKSNTEPRFETGAALEIVDEEVEFAEPIEPAGAVDGDAATSGCESLGAAVQAWDNATGRCGGRD